MLPPSESSRPIDRLLEVMECLRSEQGCPWDREQTLVTLRPHLIEEAYEVLDAMDAGDAEKHREELGDLLLQIVFHCQLRKEQGDFGFEDVADIIVQKLIRRHPHVFGDVKADDAATVLKNWDSIKKQERASDNRPESVLAELPKAMPSLLRAQEVQKRVARVGFDWPSHEPVFAKIREELEELAGAHRSGSAEHQREELGDLLFAVVNLARHLGMQAEDALHSATSKFVRRFQEVEQLAGAEGRSLETMTLDAMESLWTQVKAGERGPA